MKFIRPPLTAYQRALHWVSYAHWHIYGDIIQGNYSSNVGLSVTEQGSVVETNYQTGSIRQIGTWCIDEAQNLVVDITAEIPGN